LPYKTDKVPPGIVVYHQGVSVYHTYVEDDYARPEQFIFTTSQRETNSTSPHVFDIREMPELPAVGKLISDRPPLVDNSYASKRGMELAAYTRTPEYLALRVVWDKWWDHTLPGLIRQAIIEAIEAGNIK